ncbi:MAG: antiterminator LoaP [Clostridiaceae bacterium]|jgi:transcriptional antiterminator NusG|nr:antiterminator LoaP [Clostridiaceae bacterium]
MANWFVFHVQTGQERTACTFLNKLFDNRESIAFIPQIKIIIKRSQFIRKELKPMFPGYVFIESILGEKIFISRAYEYTKFSSCIFYLLRNGNVDFGKVREEEKELLLSFCNNEYIVEDSKGFIAGDKVFIVSGPLQGKEGIIKKINRHKRRAEIELQCFGELRHISVGLEIVSKIT